jgi:transglutaminase-like putative cysteine protease
MDQGTSRRAGEGFLGIEGKEGEGEKARIRGVEQYLKPTPIIDCDSRTIREKAQQLTGSQQGVTEKAKSLFYFVRDGIKYNPYLPRHLVEHFRASETLARKEGFCIQKAVLLVALCRAVGIPSRLGFAILRNHLLPEKLAEMLEIKLIPDHGYAELYLNGKWVKATPAFDLEMCQKNRIIPVEFDGKKDARFHSHTQNGRLHIEYILDRGPYDDVPLDEVRQWLAAVLKPEVKSRLLGTSP